MCVIFFIFINLGVYKTLVAIIFLQFSIILPVYSEGQMQVPLLHFPSFKHKTFLQGSSFKLQLIPPQPKEHLHFPDSQTPFSHLILEHGSKGVLQSAPVHPLWQIQLPAWQVECTEHFLLEQGSSGTKLKFV